MSDSVDRAAADWAAPAGRGRPETRGRPGTRDGFAVAALVLAVACLVPPVSTLAGRYVLAETIQFACFAMVIPALLVLGAPWRRLGLAGPAPAPGLGSGARNTGDTYTDVLNSGKSPADSGRSADRLARARTRNPSFMRSVAVLAAFAAVAVAWRLPPVIDAVARHPGLAVAELASLLITGVALWLELVPSSPFRPRGRGLHLAVIAAFAMWLIWVVAYILGMATHGVFHAYRYHPGGPLSAVADQELATAVLWAVAAACFMPVIFTSAHRWLHDGDDVEAELEQVTGTMALPAVKGWGPSRRGKASAR